jgi:hypothetical protein
MANILTDTGSWVWSWAFSSDALIILIAYSLLLKPASSFIKMFLAQWSPARHFDEDGSLVRAGAMIGYMERILIFTFILLDQYAAVGFILALKAAYRFKDTDNHAKAEYLLMGTFLSLILTLAVGVFVVQLLSVLAA